MNPPDLELVYFSDCPHVALARAALVKACALAGMPQRWAEWDQANPFTPARYLAYGSPTVLVANTDVTGARSFASGRACRADAIPSPALIADALTRARESAAGQSLPG